MIKKIHFILIAFTIFFGCSNNISRPEPKYITNNKDYNIKYYMHEEYYYPTKSYELIDKNILNEKQLKNKNFYLKAFFDKKTNRLNRLDKIKFLLLDEVTIYNYSKNGKLLYSNTFDNNKINTKNHYSNNRLTHKTKHDDKKKLLFTGEIKYLKTGKEEKWYNKNQRLHYAVLYNHINKPTEIAFYNKGLIKKIVKYHYNKENQLLKEESFTRHAKLIAHKSFVYNKNKYLRHVNSYAMGKLITTVEYDDYGRKVKLKYYDKNETLYSYKHNEYTTNGKTTKEYDKYNNLVKVSKYTPLGQIKSLEKIEGNTIVYSEVYKYNNNVRKTVEVKKLDKLSRKLTYNEKGLLIKNQKYDFGKLKHYIIYKYNEKNQVVQAQQYDPNKLIISWKYIYDKKGRVINEQIFKEGVLVSQIKLSYKANGKNKSKTLYHKNKPVKTLFYDPKNRVYRAITYKNSRVNNIVVYLYNKKGLLKQEKLYNKVRELDKILVYVYNKKNQRIMEHGFDKKKQYIGSRVFYYNSIGKVAKEKRYNWLKELIKVIYFDSNGNITKVDNFE